jgi:hypothetical protein
MEQFTITLTPNAARILRAKCPKRIGVGAYLSTLVTAEAAREEVRALATQDRAKQARQSWPDPVTVEE